MENLLGSARQDYIVTKPQHGYAESTGNPFHGRKISMERSCPQSSESEFRITRHGPSSWRNNDLALPDEIGGSALSEISVVQFDRIAGPEPGAVLLGIHPAGVRQN